MRRRKTGRKIDGVLLLDKRTGVSSNFALQEAKNLFGAMKAGHTGSLDPLASGLLPVCFGQATRLSSYLLDSEKRYSVEVELGRRTATGDAEGEVVEQRPVGRFDEQQLERVLADFRGRIEQVPPMYSAIRKDGKRLYELARQGKVVNREARTITIRELILRRVDLPLLELDVLCSKGTYIRTLVEDIGEALGCGATVTGLRRTRVGDYDLANGWSLDALKSLADNEQRLQCLLPLDSVVSSWPRLEFSRESEFFARQGRPVEAMYSSVSGWVRMYNEDHEFFGVGEVLKNRQIAPRKLFV